jgi:hypothetical protein
MQGSRPRRKAGREFFTVAEQRPGSAMAEVEDIRKVATTLTLPSDVGKNG